MFFALMLKPDGDPEALSVPVEPPIVCVSESSLVNPGTHGLLAFVTEWGIPEIVQQTRRRDHFPQSVALVPFGESVR